MEKKKIIANLSSLTEDQVYNEILLGNITLPELQATGDFGIHDSRYVGIKKCLEELEQRDEEDWERARYGNESSLSNYIAQHPNGKYIGEAKQKIDILEQQRREKLAERDYILCKIRQNPNAYPPNKIIELVREKIISERDLLDCGIPQSAIDNLSHITIHNLILGETPTSIPSGYTEVYFWGMTGSGKTCALGAVLQKAQQKGYLNIATGPGYMYANQLKNVFSEDGKANDFLPNPSPVETTQYLPFTLKRPTENYSRSVSLIELSGEIFKCFFLQMARHDLPTQVHVNTFSSLNNFLSSNNRKIHFFFIDYNRENKPDAAGLTQSDYLAAASNYFNAHQIFSKTTDAIFVVLTKSDLMLDENNNHIDPSQRVEYAKRFFDNASYKSFINTLKDNCKKYSINAGKLTVEPFSLGKVYFQQICDFDGSAAENILEILMDRIQPTKKSLLDIFNK